VWGEGVAQLKIHGRALRCIVLADLQLHRVKLITLSGWDNITRL
jgi:hypothetical protein